MGNTMFVQSYSNFYVRIHKYTLYKEELRQQMSGICNLHHIITIFQQENKTGMILPPQYCSRKIKSMV